MKLRDKKVAVTYQLSQEREPISLKKLMIKLGGGYAERSVRRWMAAMVKEGLIERFGNKRATRYKWIPPTVWPITSSELFFAESKELIQPRTQVNQCFGSESKKIIERVRRPLYERRPVSYADHWVDAYQPNESFYIPLEVRSQLYTAGKRSKRQEPAGTYAHQIFNRLLIDLSYNSSRLEGNTYSLLDTQKLLLEGKGAEGKLEEEKVMILNHKEAIRYLVDSAPRLKVDKETICTLHYLLSDGLIEPRYTGKVRDQGVRVGGSTYIPFENPKQLEMELSRLIEKAALIQDPYEQSLFLLVHMAYLQPFLDVNKRTARLSANIPLIKNNLVPLSFNDVEREDYISAVIAIYELQEIRPMLDLYLFSYQRTCAMYDETVKAINFDEVRVRYRGQRRALIREIILNRLVGKVMNDYLSSQTLKWVKKEDRELFFEDVIEDLNEINQSRLFGLGITPEQLRSWLTLSRSSGSD